MPDPVMRHLFIADLPQAEAGELVTLTGFVLKTRKWKNRISVQLVDISGTRWFDVPLSSPKGDQLLPRPRVGTRLRLDGRVSDEDTVSLNVENTANLTTTPGSGELFDQDRIERGARMLISRAVNRANDFLVKDGFIEFDARVIVAGTPETGLEPVHLSYPGFGAAVAIATSPAAQIIDFMNVTGVNRAFTSGFSFSTSYRFPNGSVESRVVMGKAVDLVGKDMHSWVWKLCGAVLRSLDPERFADIDWDTSPESSGLLTSSISAVSHGRYSHIGSEVREVFRLESRAASIVAECYDEYIADRLVFGGFVVYPAHLLELVDLSPNRQVRYLRRATSWGA
jgi:hypothetical protein